MGRPSKAPIRDIYISGQIAGLARQINIEALQRWVESPQPDFLYKGDCEAVLAFAKIIQKYEKKNETD
jgi:hypothetical protein